MRGIWRALLGCWLAALLGPAAARAEASFTGLGALSGATSGSVAYDLSADGATVVGGCNPGISCQAWRWTGPGGIQGLGFLPGETASNAGAVSHDGSVVFGESGSLFRWTSGGGMVDEGAGLPAHDTLLVNGASSDGNLAVGGFVSSATLQVGVYRWSSESGIEVLDQSTIPQLVSFSDVSGDGAAISGSEGIPDDGLAFIETGSGRTYLPELPQLPLPCQCGSESAAISQDGLTVVGVSHGQPFRWTSAGGTVALPQLPDTEGGVASAVDGDGNVIVGLMATSSGGFDPLFVWYAHAGTYDLRERLEDAGVDLTDWILLEVIGVSEDGRVVAGNGFNPSGDREAWRAVLPEPPPRVPALPPLAVLALAGLLVSGSVRSLARRGVPRR